MNTATAVCIEESTPWVRLVGRGQDRRQYEVESVLIIGSQRFYFFHHGTSQHGTSIKFVSVLRLASVDLLHKWWGGYSWFSA